MRFDLENVAAKPHMADIDRVRPASGKAGRARSGPGRGGVGCDRVAILVLLNSYRFYLSTI